MGSKNIFQDKLPGVSVSSDPEGLNAFKVSNPFISNGTAPSYVVRPRDVSELQAIVRLANEEKIGLVPVSSTGAHCKGGISCSKEHAVVDLSSWKKIDFINRRNRVCIIEPGVTYGELLAALDSQGMTIPVPLAPRSGKSVIGAVMDREPSTWGNRQWDISDPVSSTEFIFGTGDLFRTGAAGGPGTLEAQRKVGGAQKGPMGPSQTDFHRVVQGSQGSMGIVTWVSLRTEIKPSVQKPHVLGTDDLGQLISYTYAVQRAMIGEHSFILNRNAAAMLMSRGNTKEFETIKKSFPAFMCLQNIAGFERLPKERVDYQLKDMEEIAGRNGLKLKTSAGKVSAHDLLQTATTPFGPDEWRHSLRGHCLSVFLLSTLDRAPELIAVMAESAKKHNIAQDEIGIYLQPMVQNHCCHIEFLIPFDPMNSKESEVMQRLEADAVAALNKAHGFFSRPYGSAEKIVFKNNPGNTELLKMAKNIFDPNKVLNPGKFSLEA